MQFKQIEYAIRRWYSKDYSQGKSLDKAAMIRLCLGLPDNQALHILEAGGGHHTLFWPILAKQGNLAVQVTVLLHEQQHIQSLQKALQAAKEVRIQACSLKQLSPQEAERLWADPDHAPMYWLENGQEVAPDAVDQIRLQHTFYREAAELDLPSKSCHALILNGPYGQGRSLAFPLLGKYLADDALILINDFDHHPYLHDLGRVYNYRECYREVVGHRRWVLVQLEGRKQGEETG